MHSYPPEEVVWCDYCKSGMESDSPLPLEETGLGSVAPYLKGGTAWMATEDHLW